MEKKKTGQSCLTACYSVSKFIFIYSITRRPLMSMIVTSYFGGSGFESFTGKKAIFRAFMGLIPAAKWWVRGKQITS